MKFQQTFSTLEKAREKYGANVDPYQDAMRLTDRFGQTVRDSFALHGGTDAKDYLTIAENDYQKTLQNTLLNYQYGKADYSTLSARLNELQYKPASAIEEQNWQNVIGAAQKRGIPVKLTQEEEERARLLEDALRHSGGTGKILNGLSGIQPAQLTDTGEDAANPFKLSAGAREQYKKEAEALR